MKIIDASGNNVGNLFQEVTLPNIDTGKLVRLRVRSEGGISVIELVETELTATNYGTLKMYNADTQSVEEIGARGSPSSLDVV